MILFKKFNLNIFRDNVELLRVPMAGLASNREGNMQGIQCHLTASVLWKMMNSLNLEYFANVNDVPIPR